MCGTRLAEGVRLVTERRRVSRAGLFTYSAVTWNPHRIHLDQEYVRSLGHADLLIPGAMLADWMLQAVMNNLADGARVIRYTYRTLNPAVVDTDLDVEGSVTKVEPDRTRVEIEMRIRRSDSELAMDGTVIADPNAAAASH